MSLPPPAPPAPPAPLPRCWPGMMSLPSPPPPPGPKRLPPPRATVVNRGERRVGGRFDEFAIAAPPPPPARALVPLSEHESTRIECGIVSARRLRDERPQCPARSDAISFERGDKALLLRRRASFVEEERRREKISTHFSCRSLTSVSLFLRDSFPRFLCSLSAPFLETGALASVKPCRPSRR